MSSGVLQRSERGVSMAIAPNRIPQNARQQVLGNPFEVARGLRPFRVPEHLRTGLASEFAMMCPSPSCVPSFLASPMFMIRACSIMECDLDAMLRFDIESATAITHIPLTSKPNGM